MGIVDIDDVLQKLPDDGARAPLKPSTLRKWFSVQWDTPEHEVLATVSIMTGVVGTEAAHLAASWIEKEDGDVFIRLPNRAQCVAYSNRPCGDCRDHRNGYFSSVGHARRIPVHDDRLANLLSALASQQKHLSYRRISISIRKMVDRSSIDRPISIWAFRHTHGVAIAAKGYTRREIHRWMGNNPDAEYCHMRYAKDYRTVAETSPWDELEALGTGEFRP